MPARLNWFISTPSKLASMLPPGTQALLALHTKVQTLTVAIGCSSRTTFRDQHTFWKLILIPTFFIFSSPVQMYRKSYCTIACVGLAVSGGGGMDKMLKLYVKVLIL